MNYVDKLVTAYQRFVELPWQQSIAHAQRVWMAVYPPEHERRLRLYIDEFEIATKKAGHRWKLIDVTTAFETWMSGHEYRDAYFESPELLDSALPDFFDYLCNVLRLELSSEGVDEETVVGILGAGTLFGLGSQVKVSALLGEVNKEIRGRLLVFFPGHREGNSYRLLDARDGWNYLATPISVEGD